tara:strand:+ start:611 stop:1402 length:792 start_codon:yes stop_codon:yes gene_type:complete
MKLKYRSFLAVAIFSISVLSCGGGGDDGPDPITWEDVQLSFSQLDLSPGVKDHSIEVAANVFWTFRLVVPELETGETAPLFIDMHGESGGAANAHQTSYDCYLEEGLEGLKAFMLIPNAGQEQWYDQNNQVQIQSLISLAKDYLSVDPNKVVAMGYSNGGNATWLFTDNAPQLFSAGIAMASSYSTRNQDGSFRKINVPLYVIHGSDDQLFPIETTKAWVDGSISAGSDITFVEATGLGHYEPCNYVPYVKDAITWLQTTVWN